MLYDKLPIVLLSVLSSERKDATNSQIAYYILNHLDDVKNMKMTDLAAACHVANSSISRFCKEIGLTDYAELKEILMNNHLYFEKHSSSKNENERLNDYCNKVNQSINMVQNSIDMKRIASLCIDLQCYQKVAVFGLMKAMSAAISLQSDLLMQNKQIYTTFSYDQQLDYLKHAKKDDLIIIFSYTGSYFDYVHLRELKKHLILPKIWFITGGKRSIPEFIDEVITFESLQDQTSHPYQLQFISGLICQEYAYRHKL